MAKKNNNTHENYDRPEKIKLGSEKSFGIVFGSLFLLVAIAPALAQRPTRVWAIFVGATVLLIAIFKPKLLKRPNHLWLKFGILLNKLISPFILYVLFFLAFVPTGLLLRLFKKDILNLKIKKTDKTYWIKSESSVSSMQDQF